MFFVDSNIWNTIFSFLQYFPILEVIIFLQSYFHVLRHWSKTISGWISVRLDKQVEKKITDPRVYVIVNWRNDSVKTYSTLQFTEYISPCPVHSTAQ